MEPFTTTDTYLLLDGEAADLVDGGVAFWQALGSDPGLLARTERSWLVGTYPVTGHWDQWEMHPHGDEVIVAVAGRFRVHTERAGCEATVELVAGRTIVMPARTWHTFDVDEPGEILNITSGRGTEHRPRS